MFRIPDDQELAEMRGAEPEDQCQVQGCPRLAYYEAWMRKRDPMGLPSGLLVLVQICKEHKTHPYLVANEHAP